jgi:hypothetical protein
MDLLTYLISVALLGFAIQMNELWIVVGATLILILSSRDFKSTILLITSVALLYIVNGMGMKDYWIFAVFPLIGLAYLLGLGKEEAPQDPYAGLLGGMGGGMPGME